MAKMASGDLSLTSTSSQEEESPEYVGYDRTLRPSLNSSGSTNAANLANNNGQNSGNSSGGGSGVVGGGSAGGGGGGNGNNANVSNGNQYDVMKSPYSPAFMELNQLRHQRADALCRCEELRGQVAYYQEQYVSAMAQLESTERNKYIDVVAENARLKQQNTKLERQLIRLESENGNKSAANTANAYYYSDVSAGRGGGGGSGGGSGKCDGSCAESEKLLEELHLCKERNADLMKERSVIAAEREKYKKSFGSTLAELDNVKKERNFYRESREHFNLQRDIMEKEIQKLKSLLSEESKKVLLITVERNRIDEELKQLLSEKDNVLHEHQKMFDDLSAAKKEIENYKKNDLLYQAEINKLHQANAELQKRDLLKSNSWSKEFSDSKDDFKEVEKLRKSLEKANSEVERALQDAEQAKGVRDWAISQREKIVQERDSVKSLCDNLRKERDKAISDLLSAIRDSEKIKKQKDEAQKKIDVLKEQIENQNLDSASRRSFRMSTYEAEDLLDIELNYHSDSDIGIILDDSNNRQLVCGVTNSSPAFGKLKMNDVICKVNNLDCQTMTKRMVLDEIRSSAPRCKLLVSRTRHSKRHFYTVHLNMQNNMNHGLSLDTGVFISKIEPNSLAAYEPELDVGDRVLSINNKSMEGVHSVDDVMSLLNDERNDAITIFALKNVQDIGYGDGQRRMTTSSAQTDSIDSMHRMTSAKHPSKFSEMLSIFKKIHISKPGSDVDHFTQEHDALAELDSVLSENSSEKPRRGKRSKKEKEAAAKSMGTWPRANILNATHENPTGTIVQQREKKRPPLALFTAGPINVDKDDERETSDEQPPPLPPQAKPQAHMRNGITGAGNAIKTNPHRNSNPIPASALFSPTPGASGMPGVNGGSGNSNNVYANYMRHSVYVDPQIDNVGLLGEPTKPLQRPAPIMGANMRVKMPPVPDKYGNQRVHNYQNRYSLNITPTEFYKTSGQQAQQQVIHGGNGAEFLPRKPHIFDMLNSGNGSMGGMPHSVSSSKSQPHPALFAPLNLHPPNFARSSSTTQQNSLDMISIKSQNSIDSILSAKSPPISECAVINHYPKRGMPMPQAVTSAAGKNVAKYPSDSESIASGIMSGSVGGIGTGGGGGGVSSGLFHTSNMAAPPHNRHSQLFPTFTQNSSHPHSHAMRQIRHSSPLTLPSSPPLHAHPHAHAHPPHASALQQQSQHGVVDTAASSAIGIPTSSVDKFDMDFVTPGLPMHSQYVHDYPLSTGHYHPHTGIPGGGGVSGIIYEGGTFPRKKDHQRLRIPSNPSVASKNSAGVKNSSGSIDHHYGGGGGVGGMPNVPSSMAGAPPTMLMHHSAIAAIAANGGGSGRGSPMPQVHVEVLSHGGSKRNSNTPSDFLCPGDLRRVTIEKSDKSLGITIQCNNNGGGIFVSTVADKSIATRAGLQVGDQLLEVCGLNMRSATNDIAANVLRQCGNSITMLVQYNPEKFHSGEYDGTNNLETESPVNHSGSPTPRNSPRPPVRTMMSSLPPLPISAPTNNPLAQQTSLMPQSSSLISTQSIKDQSFADSLENQSDISSSQDLPSSAATTTTASTTSTVYEEEARYVTLRMDKSKNLGIKLFGGNKVGIFVHDVHPGSPSDIAGIRKGDQILEYNGVDLRCVTAEQAANEISKLTDTVTLLVQNKLKKLKQIKDKSGDSFYIRVGFDRTGELNDGDLRFVKDEVLYVDNTVFNGTFGLWRAWKLDAKGHRKECGIIPSQMKVEEELRAGEVVECEGGTARRGSTSARRSFFRRKKHQRSSSRDSTEIASFSNTQLSFFPDSGILNDDGGILSYQRVERLDSPVRRPVLIIGPLSERVMERLTIDFSNLFKMCEVTSMDCSQDAMEEGLQENIFVDYRRRGNKFECTTVENINNACKNDRRHCILDISISAVERLQRLQIYPIVLLLRFKSAKQIREIRDFGIDKISAKAAKEMYERALKLEADYKQYISAVIPGVSIKHMCTQIKDSVDKEQDKLLWVPVSG
ncbi:PREDICTED: disks large homolog 5 [Rhagoletis zephyria]|uniref:disks large homolog 5 n=1 Tax=Rhagoletis zephyria TaxID=28612 RepID=UPI000811A5DF|nr:PREDICTED: disks large homolog 5 [Rhagoletis zephyria]XP_017468879.1 PREDICTED: disks large homolog 5 [Rhagoletis zephyria]